MELTTLPTLETLLDAYKRNPSNPEELHQITSLFIKTIEKRMESTIPLAVGEMIQYNLFCVKLVHS